MSNSSSQMRLPSASMSRLTGLGQPNQAAARRSFDDLKKAVHNKLVDKLDASKLDIHDLDNTKRRLRPVIEHLLTQEQSVPLTKLDQERLVEEVINEVLGLGPL